MNSLILGAATRYMLPLLVLFSIFLLVRGHHEPGGGFVGGMVAAAAVSLCALAFDVPTARRVLPFPPPYWIGGGLLLSLTSGLGGLARGEPFLTAQWGKLSAAGQTLELGTPLLFDLGVYSVVLGVTLVIVFTLAEA